MVWYSSSFIFSVSVKYFTLQTVLLLSIGKVSTGANQDLVIPVEQRTKLLQFKDSVSSSIPPAYEYMKEETYLVKLLRGSQYNVDRATKNLIQELKWREENNLDKILEETFTDMELVGFKYYINQVDSEGNPVIYIPIGFWDARKAVISGKGQRIERFVYKMLVEAESKIRQKQKEGKEVTRFVILLDLKGFNLAQHACLQCLPYYTSMIIEYQRHFPETMRRVAIVNTPAIFEPLLSAMKSVMAKELRDVVEVYGTNRHNWGPEITKLLDTENEVLNDQDY